MKLLKLTTLLALLLSVAWMVTDKGWEPKITAVGLFAALISLEYSEEKKRLHNPDISLYRTFIQTVPSNGDIEYIRTQDMAGLIDKDHLQQISRFSHEWNDAEHEFINKSLEKKRKALYKSIEGFFDAYGQHVFHEHGSFYRVPLELQIHQSDKFHEAVNQLNELADAIFVAHQDLVRTARKKLRVEDDGHSRKS